MSRSLSLPLQAVTASIAIAIDPIAVSLIDISCAGVVWRRRMSRSLARLRRSSAGPFRPPAVKQETAPGGSTLTPRGLAVDYVSISESAKWRAVPGRPAVPHGLQRP
jgi:hypothetical protein